MAAGAVKICKEKVGIRKSGMDRKPGFIRRDVAGYGSAGSIIDSEVLVGRGIDVASNVSTKLFWRPSGRLW